MKNILHSFYSGEVIPWERRTPLSEEKRRLLCKIEGEEQYFLERLAELSPGDCQRFQALLGLYADLSGTEENDLFSYAFSLGMLFTVEAVRTFGD